MPPRTKLSLPTTSALRDSQRLKLSSNAKILTRLSRPSLIKLCLEWLKTHHQSHCSPVLLSNNQDDDGLYRQAGSLEELEEVYRDLQTRKGAKREIVDRVIESDWKAGLSLKQLAMLDIQHLFDRPTSQRWTALKLVPISASAEVASPDLEQRLPRFHGPTFVKNLQTELTSLVKAHYYLTRMPAMPITLLRISIFDSPYGIHAPLGSRQFEASQTVLVAFVDSTPYVYLSLNTQAGQSSSDAQSTRRIVIDALPKALSRPHERYSLKPTSLSARSLPALLSVRGPDGGNAAAGGWSIFVEGTVERSPLITQSMVLVEALEQEAESDDELAHGNVPRKRGAENELHGSEREGSPTSKRRKTLAARRFGTTGIENDGKGFERLDTRIQDPFSPSVTTQPTDSTIATSVGPSSFASPSPSSIATTPVRKRGRPPAVRSIEEQLALDGEWRPSVQLVFHGTHVFAGIRKLVECGAIDGEKMPGWMTGEAGVSVGVVRDGRIMEKDI